MWQRIGILMLFAPLVCSAAAAREWRDTTGQFSLEAELVKVTASKVELRKIDGTVITVPISKLSDDDRAFLREQQRGKQPGEVKTHRREDIEQVMRRPIEFQFVETPLTDVARFLATARNIPILIDRRALQDVGLSGNTPVTGKAKNEPLGEAIDRVLKQNDLTWLIHHDVVLITTPEIAENQLEAIVYRLKHRSQQDELIDEITSLIDPNSWDEVGGPATIEAVGTDLLVVDQMRSAHRKIADHYRRIMAPVPHADPGTGGFATPPALDKRVSCQFVETPLSNVVQFLGTAAKTTIRLDEKALNDIGIGTDTPVTLNLSGATLDTALQLILHEIDLDFSASNQAIDITTPEVAENALLLHSYRVRDIVDRGNYAALVEAITSVAAPNTWDQVGGPGAIRAAASRGSIEVSQTFAVHREISQLLADLRAAGKLRK